MDFVGLYLFLKVGGLLHYFGLAFYLDAVAAIFVSPNAWLLVNLGE